MLIMKENLSEIECTMIQQMRQSRTSKTKRETAKYAARVVEERMNGLQKQQEEGERQEQVTPQLP